MRIRVRRGDDDIRGLAAVLPNIGFSSNNITILTQHNALDTDVPDAISKL